MRDTPSERLPRSCAEKGSEFAGPWLNPLVRRQYLQIIRRRAHHVCVGDSLDGQATTRKSDAESGPDPGIVAITESAIASAAPVPSASK